MLFTLLLKIQWEESNSFLSRIFSQLCCTNWFLQTPIFLAVNSRPQHRHNFLARFAGISPSSFFLQTFFLSFLSTIMRHNVKRLWKPIYVALLLLFCLQGLLPYCRSKLECFRWFVTDKSFFGCCSALSYLQVLQVC